MKKTIWIILFALILLIDLVAVYLNNESIRFITKPLLMPAIGGYFISTDWHCNIQFEKMDPAGFIFFMGRGYIAACLRREDQDFFLLGLSAFLLAQFFIFFSFTTFA